MKESLKTIIRAQPFFTGFSEEMLDLIVGCAENVKFAPGEELMREGQPANSFYLVREGRVAIKLHGAQHGEIVVQTIEAGDLVGWSWLVPPYRSRFDATALEKTRALRFDGECLRQKCEADPAAGYELLKRVSSTLAQRLEGSRLQLMDIYGRKSKR